MYGLRQQYVHCAGCIVALPPPFDAEVCVYPGSSLRESSEMLSKQCYCFQNLINDLSVKSYINSSIQTNE